MWEVVRLEYKPMIAIVMLMVAMKVGKAALDEPALLLD